MRVRYAHPKNNIDNLNELIQRKRNTFKRKKQPKTINEQTRGTKNDDYNS